MKKWLRAEDPELAPHQDHAHLLDALGAFGSGERQPTQQKMRALLDDRPAPFDREERPGHFTGSAFVVDAACERTLLLFHTKLQIWVQPGGHADGDANLASVALREATEETGIIGLKVWGDAVDIDIHRVSPPAEGEHFHHDVRYLVLAPPAAKVRPNHESQDQRWVTMAELEAMDVDAGLVRLGHAGFALAEQVVDR